MTDKRKKKNSIIGTVISIYALIMLVNVLRANISFGKSNIVIIIIIGLIIVSRVLNLVNKTVKRGTTDFTTERLNLKNDFTENIKNVLDVDKIFDVNKTKKKSQDITTVKPRRSNIEAEEIVKIDITNHYTNQYKNLYESGIITKEELKDRINKLNK